MTLYKSYRDNLNRVFEDNGIDAIVAPSGGPAWVTDLVNGDNFSGPSSSQVAAVTGFCNVSVPAGYVHSLPVNISFIGRKFDDFKIISLAYAFETAHQVRVPPKYLPTLS